jgi:hypothetical protein
VLIRARTLQKPLHCRSLLNWTFDTPPPLFSDMDISKVHIASVHHSLVAGVLVIRLMYLADLQNTDNALCRPRTLSSELGAMYVCAFQSLNNMVNAKSQSPYTLSLAVTLSAVFTLTCNLNSPLWSCLLCAPDD